MAREVDAFVLDDYARHFAGRWAQDNFGITPNDPTRTRRRRDWGEKQLYNLAYRDEFEVVVGGVLDNLGGEPKRTFALAVDRLRARYPRTDEAFAAELAQRLAVDTDGVHLLGKKGRVRVDRRWVGEVAVQVEAADSIRRRKRLGLPKTDRYRELVWKIVPAYWDVYAGEEEERGRVAVGARRFLEDGADPLDPLPFPELRMALNTRIDLEAALGANDAIVDLLDEGSGAAILRLYTASQTTDPDTTISSQTLLGTLVCSDPAFGASVDDDPGAIATAAAVASDTSADATGTVAFLRAFSTNDGATPLNAHIDGEAGTGTADFVFNTTSIVTGAQIDLDSWTFRLPQWSGG